MTLFARPASLYVNDDRKILQPYYPSFVTYKIKIITNNKLNCKNKIRMLHICCVLCVCYLLIICYLARSCSQRAAEWMAMSFNTAGST